jgi:ectoine hydroxylase-related dioxygenase (phytanoyl-CoA dioxygenase family)
MEIARIQQHFQRFGYAIVDGLLGDDSVQTLRFEAETLRELACFPDASNRMIDASTRSCVFETTPSHLLEANPQLGVSLRAFCDHRSAKPFRHEALKILIASNVTELAIQLLGTSTCCLFNEQYIIKSSCTESPSSTAFGWHRDSDWLPVGEFPHYLSIWVALDDVDETNGCLVVRPGSHAADIESAGTTGGEQLSLPLAAGSAVVMLNTLQHASGVNMSRFSRRAWMAQYSAAPVIDSSSNPIALAIPLIQLREPQ